MAQSEICIADIHISKNVISTVVSLAANKVEGIASVGGNVLAFSLISVLTPKAQTTEAPVECEVVDDGLKICVRLTVFYGYPFTKLAEQVRIAVAQAVREQIGVEVAAVDVCIDGLVFPKE